MQEYDDTLLMGLERDLEDYDRIFLVFIEGKAQEDFFAQFCGSEELGNCGKKILILSAENLMENRPDRFRKISCQTAARLKELYFMYEFSDRFRLLSREECFGGILNLVDTGILTKEEAFSALLF